MLSYHVFQGYYLLVTFKIVFHKLPVLPIIILFKAVGKLKEKKKQVPCKKIAIVCGSSLREGLHMMVASHRFATLGYQVTTYHNKIFKLQRWFEEHHIEPRDGDILKHLKNADFVVYHHSDNEASSEFLSQLRKLNIPLSIFFSHFNKNKKTKLSNFDQIFDKRQTMADNIAYATSSLLRLDNLSKNNGLTPLNGLEFRKYKKRVILQPSIKASSKYKKLEYFIQSVGFETLWIDQIDIELAAPLIYESGYFISSDSDLTHLASNLQIPTLFIKGRQEKHSIYQPGWLRGITITPPIWFPKAKESRTPLSRMLGAFKSLVAKDQILL